MKLPFRTRLEACIHPETFKYFLEGAVVSDVWQRLSDTYGTPERNVIIPMLQIDGRTLIIRAPACGNPITVIRKRKCTEADVVELHQLFGFELEDGNDTP